MSHHPSVTPCVRRFVYMCALATLTFIAISFRGCKPEPVTPNVIFGICPAVPVLAEPCVPKLEPLTESRLHGEAKESITVPHGEKRGCNRPVAMFARTTLSAAGQLNLPQRETRETANHWGHNMADAGHPKDWVESANKPLMRKLNGTHDARLLEGMAPMNFVSGVESSAGVASSNRPDTAKAECYAQETRREVGGWAKACFKRPLEPHSRSSALPHEFIYATEQQSGLTKPRPADGNNDGECQLRKPCDGSITCHGRSLDFVSGGNCSRQINSNAKALLWDTVKGCKDPTETNGIRPQRPAHEFNLSAWRIPLAYGCAKLTEVRPALHPLDKVAGANPAALKTLNISGSPKPNRGEEQATGASESRQGLKPERPCGNQLAGWFGRLPVSKNANRIGGGRSPESDLQSEPAVSPKTGYVAGVEVARVLTPLSFNSVSSFAHPTRATSISRCSNPVGTYAGFSEL